MGKKGKGKKKHAKTPPDDDRTREGWLRVVIKPESPATRPAKEGSR